RRRPRPRRWLAKAAARSVEQPDHHRLPGRRLRLPRRQRRLPLRPREQAQARQRYGNRRHGCRRRAHRYRRRVDRRVHGQQEEVRRRYHGQGQQAAADRHRPRAAARRSRCGRRDQVLIHLPDTRTTLPMRLLRVPVAVLLTYSLPSVALAQYPLAQHSFNAGPADSELSEDEKMEKAKGLYIEAERLAGEENWEAAVVLYEQAYYLVPGKHGFAHKVGIAAWKVNNCD